MLAISTSHLGLHYGTETILDDVSIGIEEGDRVGIVGVNGAGKSSFIRLLLGEIEPSEGEIYIAANRTIGHLAQDDAFRETSEIDGHPISDHVMAQMTAAFPEHFRAERRMAELEDVLARATGDELTRASAEYATLSQNYARDGGLEYRSRCESTLLALGFDRSVFDLPISSLSGGQRTRLALARLLSRSPDILILDEPTNHLDVETMRWLETILAAYRKTVVVVSHDRYFLDKITNKTIEIVHHHAKLYRGNYTEFTVKRKAEREAQERAYKNQQKEIARQEAYIAQQRQWNRERNIIAAESREKALARMEKVERPEADPRSIGFSFRDAGESGNDVLTVERLSMAYGDKKLFSDVSFLLKRKDHLFIVGENGSGKSTLVKILMGKLNPTGGRYEYGYHVEVGYYDQENQNLHDEKTVFDEVADAYPKLTQTEVRSALALFRFTGDDVFKAVGMLSGGERARLTLSKLLLSRVNVLVLDEPTNHLDIPSREALEEALSRFDGTLIAVSHDRYFVSSLATRILEIVPGSGVLDFHGTYEEYRSFAEKRENAPKTATVENATSAKEQFLSSKQLAAQKRKIEKRKAFLETEIPRLEERLLAVENELFGEAASDYERAAALDTEKTELENTLLSLYEEQETLAEE